MALYLTACISVLEGVGWFEAGSRWNYTQNAIDTSQFLLQV